MRSHVSLAVVAAAWLTMTVPVAAQQTPPQVAPVAVDTSDAAPSPERARLEAQLAERTAQVVRKQLQLTDSQFTQLQQVNRKYEPTRQQLNAHERYLRLSLRAELALGAQADQSKVNDYLDQLGQVQQSRLEVFRNEQQDLGTFLTPVQRAKYAAIQEQIRNRLTKMRQRQMERRAARAGARVRPR